MMRRRSRIMAAGAAAALVLSGGALTTAPVAAQSNQLAAAPRSINDELATSAPAVASAFLAPGQPYSQVFYRGQQGEVLNRPLINGQLYGAVSLGGKIVGAPGAAGIWGTAPERRNYVVARGTDNALWYRERINDRGDWSPWASLGGKLTGPPAVTGDSLVTYYYVRGTDGALWTKRVGNVPGGQTSWTSLGGRVLADTGPAATVVHYGAFRLVYVVGTDFQLWFRTSSDGVNYTPWRRDPYLPPASQGHVYTTDSPAVAEGNLMFMHDAATSGLTVLLSTAAKEEWIDLGGLLSSGPGANAITTSARSLGEGYDVAARGTDNRIWFRSQRNNLWGPWKTW